MLDQANPGQIAEPEEECLQRCDEKGVPSGMIRRGEAHGGSFVPHMAVHIIVERSSGALLLQRRSLSKRIKPGLWDTSVGGHVDRDESVEHAARRELREELGIEGETPREIYRYFWRSEIECEYIITHHLMWDQQVSFPSEEISEVRDWFVEEIQSSSQDLFTPNFLHELDRFVAWRQTGG